MFKCTGTEKIYVVSPAYNRTGGLELLHQLVYALNQKVLRAYITYLDIDTKRKDSPINEAYVKYVTEYKSLSEIEDSEENIIILPELSVNMVTRFKNAKVAVWWLSVDNYLKAYTVRKAYELIGFKGVLWYLKNRKWRYKISKIKNLIKYNLAQSYYAVDFLKSNDFSNIMYLSDYINLDYLSSDMHNVLGHKRKDVVLYNPKKGLKFTKYLMSLSSDVVWKPLQNMTNSQVKEALLNSKVYIDFGNHPGKDRFPREAAICGCCIITGKKGAAGFHEDIPIPSEYKFDDRQENGERVIAKIHDCFMNFERNQMDFDEYRDMISGEYRKFCEDIEHVFLE